MNDLVNSSRKIIDVEFRVPDGTSFIVKVPEENLWPVVHLAEVFKVSGLVDKKTHVSGYGDSWREFGPAGMFVHTARKFKRLRRELWDRMEVKDVESINEVVDDVLVFFSRIAQLLVETPNDLTGISYVKNKEFGPSTKENA